MQHPEHGIPRLGIETVAASGFLQPPAGAFVNLVPTAQDDHPVTELLDLDEKMRTHNDRDGEIIAQLSDPVTEIDDTVGIQPVRRLIENQQPGPGQQCLGKREPLAHALTVSANLVMDAVFEPDPAHRFFHGDSAHSTGERSQHLEIPPPGQIFIEPRRLKDGAHLPHGPLPFPGHGNAGHLHQPAIRVHQPQNDADGSAFARTIVAQKTKNFAIADFEI